MGVDLKTSHATFTSHHADDTVVACKHRSQTNPTVVSCLFQSLTHTIVTFILTKTCETEDQLAVTELQPKAQVKIFLCKPTSGINSEFNANVMRRNQQLF